MQQFRIIGPVAEFARIDRFVAWLAKRYMEKRDLIAMVAKTTAAQPSLAAASVSEGCGGSLASKSNPREFKTGQSP
ncbi:hypothetical protein ACTJJ7_07275 [Phyllobacterium sp. 22229]|uniref:hypothetical protein n=1 Tax=Phyllobacterium sp. 22229 TaxID=3453895 RepID=UPI003F830164